MLETPGKALQHKSSKKVMNTSNLVSRKSSMVSLKSFEEAQPREEVEQMVKEERHKLFQSQKKQKQVMLMDYVRL